jgi:hypothetical protein
MRRALTAAAISVALLARVAMAAEPLPSPELLLERVRAAYSVGMYHDKTVVYRPSNDWWRETTETYFSRSEGLKYTERGTSQVPRQPSRTIVYWGKTNCLQRYWEENGELTPCRDVCLVSQDALPLRVVCHYVLGQPVRLPANVDRQQRVEWRVLDGKPMFVLTDLTDSGELSELWVVPGSFRIKRFVLFSTNVTGVDFQTVELGPEAKGGSVSYTPRVSPRLLMRKHPRATGMLALLIGFGLATGIWMLGYRIGGKPIAIRSAKRKARWRIFGLVAAVGYGCVLVLGLALLGAKEGHPPAVFLAVIAGFLCTNLLVAIGAILAASHLAEWLTTSRRAHPAPGE